MQGDCNVPEKKLKTAGKRKSSKKLNFDEEKSSPVSGTLIRVLEEGESIPAVHKGEQLRMFLFRIELFPNWKSSGLLVLIFTSAQILNKSCP